MHRFSMSMPIFDMDGLMLDTERLRLDPFRKAADGFGFPTLDAVYFQSVGLNSRDTKHFSSQS
jgi:beta-phosphoglucomutase-like phosphatase (HAD superfamily)